MAIAMVIFLLIISVVLCVICAVVARKQGRFLDALITLLSTLVAALLALAMYLYGVNTNDQVTYARLQRLLRVELTETIKLVGPNAARWNKIAASGEPSNNVYYTFAPKVIVVDALKSGMFTNDEDMLLKYLLALENYNKVMESSIAAFSVGSIPGGDKAGLVGRIVLSAAAPVNTGAEKLLARINEGK